VRLILAALATLGGLAQALAYSAPSLFDTAPSGDSTGGAAGIYYTGAPRFQGQDCSGCHQGDDHAVTVRVSALPGDLLNEPYRPGAVYHVEVNLGRDRLGPRSCPPEFVGEACNLNLFALEIDTVAGHPTGTLCPLPFEGEACPEKLGTPTVLTRDKTAVLANGLRFGADGQPGYRDGQTAYDFYWRAPATDVGSLHMWIAAVDGDGGQSSPEKPSDTDNDATGVFRVLICGPSGCPAADDEAGGCAATPRGAPLDLLGLVPLALLGWRVRRRTR